MPPTITDHRNALPAGYQLAEYRILSILGHGGFGITYLAHDEDLHQNVAIKEYLPREVATRESKSTVAPISDNDREIFEWGLERFLDETRTLTRFQHPNIIGVRRLLKTNGTAYLVMDYCAGESLDSLLDREKTLSPDALEKMLPPLLDALQELHSVGIMHRDIKPGNLYLREDGSPVLLDFGAARQALAQHSRSVTSIATPGYAAIEQYSTRGKQGPWTDIYGLGATLYRCVTGNRPTDSSARMLDEELIPAVQAGIGYPSVLLERIDVALTLKPDARPQSIAEWLSTQPVTSKPAPSEANPSPAQKSPLMPRHLQTDGKSTGERWIVVGLLAVFFFFIYSYFSSRSPPDTPAQAGRSPAATGERPSPPAASPPPPREREPTGDTAQTPPEADAPEPVHLTIQTLPENAQVRILNIVPVYHDGIELAAGSYHIEVSAPGHQTLRRWYTFTEGSQVVQVTLEPQPSTPRVASPPPAPAGRASIPPRLLAGRYHIRGNEGEIVLDTVSSLEWQRCSLGQQWTGQACIGEAERYTWDQARNAASREIGWRLPTQPELMTLVYCSSLISPFKNTAAPCPGDHQQPTIVEEAFPGTQGEWYRTGSRAQHWLHSTKAVGFFNGATGEIPPFSERPVRLVRNRE